ncbi:MAG: glycosyl hydrolase, partial [Verrucomicrobiota bacterium]
MASNILQQGHFVADVCAYYGDQTPNFWPLFHDVPTKPRYPGLDPGYDYGVVNSDVILNRMTVANGRVVLPDGMSYRLLVLPAQDHIPAEVLQRIAELVKSGAIILGPKPTRDPRLADQVRRTARVQQLADELWGHDEGATAKGRPVGRGGGSVFAGLTPTQVLTALGVTADFHYDPKPGGPEADFIHRQTPDGQFYFCPEYEHEFRFAPMPVSSAGAPAGIVGPRHRPDRYWHRFQAGTCGGHYPRSAFGCRW